MPTLRDLKQTYNIPFQLFTDILETIETALYYNIQHEKLIEYTLDHCSIETYSTQYSTYTKFVKNFIQYLHSQDFDTYDAFTEHMQMVCDMYTVY